ncbi:MAG TPA: calcium-binding protein [Actinomycetota bacterium]|nr:calcium-binding protein [Actinomycetota bacterium]
MKKTVLATISMAAGRGMNSRLKGSAPISVVLVALFAIGPRLTPPVSAQEGHKCEGEAATIVGTEGDDDLKGTDSIDVIVALGGNDTVRGFEATDYVCGGSGKDTLYGGSQNDVLSGGDGNDHLVGRGGPDDLTGGRGDDVIRGGAGKDLFSGERLTDDTVEVGDDRYDGGAGRDSFWLGFTEIPTHVDLSQERAFSEGRDVLLDIEDVAGSRQTSNRLIGDEERNRLLGGGEGDVKHGRGGNDLIAAGFDSKDDRLEGGRGDDRLRGSLGDDTAFVGGPGTDTLRFVDARYQDLFVDLSSGIVSSEGESGTLAGIENVSTGAGDDRLVGSDERNVLDGGPGKGADDLRGADGDDVLIGRGGQDKGDGGPGTDTCVEIERRVSCKEEKPGLAS